MKKEKPKWAWPIGGKLGRPRPQGLGRPRAALGPAARVWGAPLGEAHPAEVLPSPSAYIKASQVPLAHWFLSLPLLHLAWLPHLEMCQRVEGNLLFWMLSNCRISNLNPPSSAALLDRSPDDVYTPYVCNPSEVPHLRHYVVAPVLLHWSCGIMELWCHAHAVLVFIDCTTTRPWGRLRLSSSTMFVREGSRALGLQWYEYCHCSITVQLRRWIMG
jgi:hypothetical protein